MRPIQKAIINFYLKSTRRSKRWTFRLLDSLAICLSIYLAFTIRFDLFVAWDFIQQHRDIIYLLLPIKLICFSLAGLYRPIIRYVGMEFFSTAMISVVSSTGLVALAAYFLRISSFPRSIFILDGLLTLIFIISSRVIVRWLVYRVVAFQEIDKKAERVLIYGAGAAGSQLAQALTKEERYRVMAFVDDNRQLYKHVIGGLKVYGRKDVEFLVKRYKIESVLFAIPSASKMEKFSIIQSFEQVQVQVKTIPGISEIVSGKVEINHIRKVDILDLLGREEVHPINELLEKNIQGKSILVTGAGGSIGSELCRQIVQHDPTRLILYERNEFALYSIEMELKEKYPTIKIIASLSSVTDQKKLESVFKKYQVQTIYHAAAYKHVPLVEENLEEGIKNNVFGTLACVKAAVDCKVKTFVLISTDKAVRPTNVMGTTKRIAELLLQAFSKLKKTQTQFSMVRFGNVLNSNGSVVPRFRDQIARGEDITVTHRDITRYFMSIPEAARLVIQAGALGKGGDVFLLEMGEPVKIYDLARQMIKLSGMELGRDINIQITGLRPGEKLYEELLIDAAKNTPTRHPKIFSAEEHWTSWDQLSLKLEALEESIEMEDRLQIITRLKEIVSEFKPDQKKNLGM